MRELARLALAHLGRRKGLRRVPGSAVGIPLFVLFGGSAWAWELVSVPGFYPDPLQTYPQPLQLGLPSSLGPESVRQRPDDVFKVETKFDAFDAARSKPGGAPGFIVPKNGETNGIEDFRFSLATSDERVRLSLRAAESFYAANSEYLRLLASRSTNKNSPGKERFLFREGAEGAAGLARLDVKVLDADWLGASTFASHRDVDTYFESLAAEKAKDEFSVANRSSEVGGGKLRFGSFSLTASYATSSGLSGAALPAETKQERSITFDLTDFRKRTGDFLPAALWSLAPAGVYVGSFVKETAYGAAEGPPDRTSGANAGAYWTWNGGSANASYWNYYLDSRRTGEASYDSTGRGFDVSVSLYGALLQYYGGFSYHRSEDLAELSRGVDTGFDAYSSVTYKPPHLPEVVIDGSIGRYGYRSLSDGMADDAVYWSTGIGLELFRFLWGTAGTKQDGAVKSANVGSPSLKVFYRYSTEADRGTATESHSDDHLFGVAFRFGSALPAASQFGMRRRGNELVNPLAR